MKAHQQPAFLAQENHRFAGTGGVSENNRQAFFVPAFKNSLTGEVALSRFRDGRIAPCHLIDGLPDEWIVECDGSGEATGIKASIISGFVRLGRFFTRQEACDYMELCSKAS